jgi:hypothetical protein
MGDQPRQFASPGVASAALRRMRALVDWYLASDFGSGGDSQAMRHKDWVALLRSRTDEQRAQMKLNAKQAATNPKLEAEAREVLSALEQFEQEERQTLEQHVRSLPIARRIAEAFKAEPPTETEVKLVQVLLDHPLEYAAREQADICWQATLTSWE